MTVSVFSKKCISIVVLIAVSLFVTGCGGGGGGGGDAATSTGSTASTENLTGSTDSTENLSSDPGDDLLSKMQTASLSLSWTAPVTRADGSPISLSEIGGYSVYYGQDTGSYPDSLEIEGGHNTSVTITDLPQGTYYLVLTTRDTDGRESGYSTEVAKVVN
jgi:hypothetical protein